MLYAKGIKVAAAADRLKITADRSSKRVCDYDTTTIRVRLPHRLYAEARFLATETVGDVRQFVDSCLRHVACAPSDAGSPAAAAAALSEAGAPPSSSSLSSSSVPLIEYYLYLTPPRYVLNDDTLTLKKLRLVPSAIINFSITTSTTSDSAGDPEKKEKKVYEPMGQEKRQLYFQQWRFLNDACLDAIVDMEAEAQLANATEKKNEERGVEQNM